MKSPKDWELMSQKKDIEEIKCILNQNINKKENILKKGIASLIVAIISSFTASFLTSWMDNNDKNIPIILYLLVVLAVIILSIIPFLKDIIKYFTRKEKSDDEKRIEQVNLFDNDIIYNIMLANKYFDLSLAESNFKEEKEFYISESKYYIRKSVHQLNMIKIYSVTKKIDGCIFGINKKIEIERIKSALEFIEFILTKLDDDNFKNSLISDINHIKIQHGIKKYLK